MQFTDINENTFKYQEVKEYFQDWIKENSTDDKAYMSSQMDDWTDVHHNAFNTDYYIIGTYKAKKWLGEEAFNVIGIIKDYEEFNFGKLTTDISDPEKVVNMYVYILGEEIVAKWDMIDRRKITAA